LNIIFFKIDLFFFRKMETPPEWKLLLASGEIDKICDYLAGCLNDKFKGRDVTLVCILNGAVPFFTELSYRLRFEHSWAFIRASSYKNMGQSKLSITPITEDIRSKTVILVDELLDSGHTMCSLKEYFEKLDKEVYTCVAFGKHKSTEFRADFCGITLPDVWLVGFGLDHDQKFRNLKAVYGVPGGKNSLLLNDPDLMKKTKKLIELLK
jgi:hypoxanthine phosphoribosyltransferase